MSAANKISNHRNNHSTENNLLNLLNPNVIEQYEYKQSVVKWCTSKLFHPMSKLSSDVGAPSVVVKCFLVFKHWTTQIMPGYYLTFTKLQEILYTKLCYW